MKYLIKSKKEMAALASQLARKVIAQPKARASVIGLVGNLGAGKTTFTQSFLKALGVTERVMSPTFVLFRPYKLTIRRTQGRPANYRTAYHFDAYRLDTVKELLALGFKKIIRQPGNIVLVEWADRFKKAMPKQTIWVTIKHGHKKTHRVVHHS